MIIETRGGLEASQSCIAVGSAASSPKRLVPNSLPNKLRTKAINAIVGNYSVLHDTLEEARKGSHNDNSLT